MDSDEDDIYYTTIGDLYCDVDGLLLNGGIDTSVEAIKESLNNVLIISNRTPISKNPALKFQDEAGFA